MFRITGIAAAGSRNRAFTIPESVFVDGSEISVQDGPDIRSLSWIVEIKRTRNVFDCVGFSLIGVVHSFRSCVATLIVHSLDDSTAAISNCVLFRNIT